MPTADNINEDVRCIKTLAVALGRRLPGDDRFVKARPGTKRPAGKWKFMGSGPETVDRDYLVITGDGLVVLDIDDFEKLPDRFRELPATFTVKSPHAGPNEGHRYYLVDGYVPSRSRDWGEIQAAGSLLVGPGSEIHGLRDGDDCKDGCCSAESPGVYRVADDREIATVSADRLRIDDGDTPRETTTTVDPVPPEISDDDVAEGEAVLRDFHNDDRTTQRARDYLTDLLKGRYLARGFESDDDPGQSDRNEAEYHLFGLLYGAFRKYGNEADAERLARAYMGHACRENPYTADGRPRKWNRDPAYRDGRARAAVRDFDLDVWDRWRRKRAKWRTWSDDYSDRTYEVVLGVTQSLAELNDTYPTRREIVKHASLHDPDRKGRTHETALKRLQREYGQVKMAFCPGRSNGKRYVYFPASFPDPDDAECVKISGEKRTPE